MVNISVISAIIFYTIVILLFFKTRERWQVQGGILALYRTKLGITWMEKLATKFPKTIKFLGFLGVIFGFIGMILILLALVKSAFDVIFVSGAPPGVAPVLPGIKIPGFPTLSFWHWLIGIFVLATVHEFAHGVMAVAHKLKVNSSGFGFLGPILLAFVEPDEKKVKKAKKSTQLSIFAAGPFSNFIFAIIFILISILIITPISNSIFEADGIQVNSFTKGYPAEKSGLELPFIIEAINNQPTSSLEEFVEATEEIKPNQIIKLKTDQGIFEIITIKNKEDPKKGLIGITNFEQKTKITEGHSKLTGDIIQWFQLLFFWLFILNFFVGLFNLLPLGPIDGGRMFYIAALSILKNEKAAKKVWSYMLYIVLLLLFINIIPWFIKAGTFLLKLLS